MKLCAACDAIHEIHPAIADIMLTSAENVLWRADLRKFDGKISRFGRYRNWADVHWLRTRLGAAWQALANIA